MLRGGLANARVPGRPILDWAHLARRVQAAELKAKGLKVLTGRAYRAGPIAGRARLHQCELPTHPMLQTTPIFGCSTSNRRQRRQDPVDPDV
jgi:hypothetical protein